MAKGVYIVRFNLGAGVNYLKWKITSPLGVVEYLDPNKVSISMYGCKLVNQKSTAKKIHDGANKSVCAWIEAAEVHIGHCSIDTSLLTKVSYNPRVTPNWVMNNENVDKHLIDALITQGRSIWANGEKKLKEILK